MDRGAWRATYSSWGHKEPDITTQLTLTKTLDNLLSNLYT